MKPHSIVSVKEDSPYPKFASRMVLLSSSSERRCLLWGKALNTSKSIQTYVRLLIGKRDHEVFVTLFLDAQNRLIETLEMFRGTLAAENVQPKELVRQALKFQAASVILAHNRPAGVAGPLQADEIIIRRLKEALALMDIKLADYLIVAQKRVFSFADQGLIQI